MKKFESELSDAERSVVERSSGDSQRENPGRGRSRKTKQQDGTTSGGSENA